MTASIFPAKQSKSLRKKNSAAQSLPSSSGNTLLQKLSMREKLKNDPFSQSAFGLTTSSSTPRNAESNSTTKTSSVNFVTPKNHDPQKTGGGLALLGSYASSSAEED